MDSTDALVLDDVPGRLLVIGGGIIGLDDGDRVRRRWARG